MCLFVYMPNLTRLVDTLFDLTLTHYGGLQTLFCMAGWVARQQEVFFSDGVWSKPQIPGWWLSILLICNTCYSSSSDSVPTVFYQIWGDSMRLGQFRQSRESAPQFSMLPILLKAVLVWAAAFNLTLGCAVCWFLLRNWLRHLQQVFYFFLRTCATLWCLSCCRGRLLSIAETEKQDFTKTSTTFFLGFGIKWSQNWGVRCHSSVV